jgi:hypothetical protein
VLGLKAEGKFADAVNTLTGYVGKATAAAANWYGTTVACSLFHWRPFVSRSRLTLHQRLRPYTELVAENKKAIPCPYSLSAYCLHPPFSLKAVVEAPLWGAEHVAHAAGNERAALLAGHVREAIDDTEPKLGRRIRCVCVACGVCPGPANRHTVDYKHNRHPIAGAPDHTGMHPLARWFKLALRARVALAPLTNQPPFFGAVQLGFVDRPKMDADFIGCVASRRFHLVSLITIQFSQANPRCCAHSHLHVQATRADWTSCRTSRS